eukprot:TRINITY_DN16722_c0_g1_i1.p2 TRINITY_DN16722_c0_g1~~TRINITY_DN16722_c0_g1_i1.p2  ORF type:complete len:324 (+),score=146.98 TRINITY_DN16722_c0_g1_i1:73-972(+)
MAFWGCVLSPGQKKTVESPEGEILHLSQACLHNPNDGKNYIQAEVSGTTYSIACLEKGKKEHDSFDLFFDPTTCAFKNQGKSEVHLTGYFEPDDGFYEDDEEEDAPKAKAKAKAAAPKAEVKKSSPKVEAKQSPKVEAKQSPKVAAKESPKVAAQSPKQKLEEALKKKAAEEDDEDSDMEEGEEELIEEGEESELEESEAEDAPPVPAKGGKRKADAPPAAAPPAKKAAASPKAAPAAGGGDNAGYVKALVEYLKKNGKTSTSTLGSKVTKPAGTPKLKVIFTQNPDKFNVQGDQVTAK